MLKYSQLTTEQKKYICNGCGSKGAFIKVPNFLFLASCNQHDFYYWLGKSEEDRVKANDSFYKWMREDIATAVWYKKPYYYIWAYAYYKAVVIEGKKYFNYGSRYKTMDDLIQEMKLYTKVK